MPGKPLAAPDLGAYEAGLPLPIYGLRSSEGAHICGNGDREGPEDCDDGNQLAGDGCSVTCSWELGGGGLVPGPDAGLPPPDANVPLPDNGAPSLDATVPVQDAGQQAPDTAPGAPEDEAGAPLPDASAPPASPSPARPDGGVIGVDAVPRMPGAKDAGPPTADGGTNPARPAADQSTLLGG